MIYQPHAINELKNFISGWYISKELCQDIVKSTQGPNRLKFYGQEYTGGRGYIQGLLKTLSPDLYNQYKIELTNLFNLYLEEYEFLKYNTPMPFARLSTNEQGIEHVLIQKYNKNNYFRVLHSETSGLKDNDRTLVFMTYLNDIKDGGGTEWPYQNFQSSAEQGLTLLWPANWTHPHRGIVSKTEEKYIITGWYINTL